MYLARERVAVCAVGSDPLRVLVALESGQVLQWLRRRTHREMVGYAARVVALLVLSVGLAGLVSAAAGPLGAGALVAIGIAVVAALQRPVRHRVCWPTVGVDALLDEPSLADRPVAIALPEQERVWVGPGVQSRVRGGRLVS
jgi:hypothetical protein